MLQGKSVCKACGNKKKDALQTAAGKESEPHGGILISEKAHDRHTTVKQSAETVGVSQIVEQSGIKQSPA